MRILTVTLVLLTSTLMAGELSGRRAPSFSLPDVKGKQVDLLDYRGKVVVLDIMRSNCPMCVALAKTLVRLQAKYGNKMGVISIVNPPDSPKEVAQFMSAHNVTSPVLFDCGQVAYSYMKTAQFDIPHVFLLDARGMIREDFAYSVLARNIFEGDGLAPYIERLLAEGTAGKAAARPAAKK